jgi:hypothetical protein
MSAMNAMTMRPRFPLRLRPRLHLCIASGHVRLDLLQPLRSTGVRMTWRMVWAYLRGQDRAFYQVVGTETVSGTINTHTLQATVQQALQQLARSSHTRLAGSALTVEVGPALARVGVLELDGAEAGTSAPRLSAADLHAYAQAWVTHTWGLEPTGHVIRCQPLQRGGQYLLVCVDNFVPTQLERLCLQQGIRFSDCTPALVNALATAPATARGQQAGRAAKSVSVSVLMESAPGATNAPQAPGAGIAQWVVMDESGPLSVCRTWLGGATPALQDDEVTHLARRLCAQHQLPEATPICRLVWPIPAASATRGTTP